MNEQIRSAGHVFISYRREDSASADKLQGMLEGAGIRVWRDKADLWPGDDWRAVVRRAITDGTLVFLACFSTVSLARTASWQNEELNLAAEQMRLRLPDEPWLIPVRFDDCEIPVVDVGAGRTLRSIHYCDLFGEESDRQAARLVATVQRILRQPPDGRAAHDPASDRRSRRSRPVLRAAAVIALLAVASAIVTFIARQARQPGKHDIGTLASAPRAVSPSGRPLRDPSASRIYAGIAFSPDGNTLATTDGNLTSYLWNVPAATPAASLTIRLPGRRQKASHANSSASEGQGITNVAFSPDGTTLAAADENGTVYLWNIASGKIQASFPIGQGAITAIAFSPKRDILAAAAGSVTYLWDLTTREPATQPLRDPDIYAISSLAFNPAGSILAVANVGGQAYLWNLAASKPIRHHLRHGPLGSIYGITFGHDGTVLATADSNGHLDLWNTATRKLATRLPTPGQHSGLYAVAFEANGTTLAAADGTGHVYLWNTSTDHLIITFDDHTTGAQTIALNRQNIVAAHNDGRTYLWNTSHPAKAENAHR